MKRLLFFLLFLSVHLAVFASHTDPTAKKDTTKHGPVFSAGAGFIYTSLNFFKNYQEETYYSGLNGRLLVQFNDRFRLSADLAQVESVNILPIWLNVKNTFYDLDGHILMHFANQSNLAYFIMGISAQHWEGFYTGIHDLNGWRLKIPANSTYSALYYGITLGMGAEVKLTGPLSLFGEFRFRISKTDVGTGLNDVLYGAGLKINFITSTRKHGKHHSLLRFRDKYHWF